MTTILALLIACVMGYIGIVVSISLMLSGLEGGAGPMSIISMITYLLLAYVAPLIMGIFYSKTRNWGALRSLRLTASISLAVNIVLSPIGIGAMSM
ncbi:hypothetical protein SA2016_0809 [Sinomonas atrocyanea]|uniref:Uncharacterized protein n=2 Tax=Sinomonas atrocyanea TaxID=37927 RepID=A0A126ZX10_9MICC|nr:hypothetical protein SA2016_0809 [Sinomonas atrocyanea]